MNCHYQKVDKSSVTNLTHLQLQFSISQSSQQSSVSVNFIQFLSLKQCSKCVTNQNYRLTFILRIKSHRQSTSQNLCTTNHSQEFCFLWFQCMKMYKIPKSSFHSSGAHGSVIQTFSPSVDGRLSKNPLIQKIIAIQIVGPTSCRCHSFFADMCTKLESFGMSSIYGGPRSNHS